MMMCREALWSRSFYRRRYLTSVSLKLF